MSAGSSGSSTDNKVRFDLKQISQWDKQIKQDYQKKIQKGTGSQQHHQGHRHHSSRSKAFDHDDPDQDNVTGGSGYKYRDRALERRKDLNGLVTYCN